MAKIAKNYRGWRPDCFASPGGLVMRGPADDRRHFPCRWDGVDIDHGRQGGPGGQVDSDDGCFLYLTGELEFPSVDSTIAPAVRFQGKDVATCRAT